MENKREFKSFMDMEEEAIKPIPEPVPEPSACVNYEKDEIVSEPVLEPKSRPNKPNFIGRKW